MEPPAGFFPTDLKSLNCNGLPRSRRAPPDCERLKAGAIAQPVQNNASVWKHRVIVHGPV